MFNVSAAYGIPQKPPSIPCAWHFTAILLVLILAGFVLPSPAFHSAVAVFCAAILIEMIRAARGLAARLDEIIRLLRR